MKLSAPERFWKSGVVAGVCFWMTPFVVFVRFQGYPLTHPETLVCLGILATLGVASGLLMETAGQYSRALVFGLLITLTVDVQVENPGPIWMLITVCVLSVGVMFLLRNHLARAGTAILVVMLVVSFVSPTGKADSRYVYAEPRSPGDESLPVLLHIILDEQIGVEGVPVEFDRDGKHTRALRDFYLEHGFQVFGRAYSRYDNTTATLARLFNFDSSGYRKTGGKRRRQRATAGLAENAYFDLMSSRGYQINVYQTGYFDLCGNMTNGKTSTCFTYGTEAISSIEGSSLSTRRKIRTIFGVYSRLSVILMDLNVPTIRLSAVSAAGIMDELRDDLLRARPGS
ncbi:MAG: hypothetical protein IH969_10275, partial [Candidatus Krumholzibacteriota bacterium]|nr:hypothetical protein [Candidatus Krumholzibacteriota bacterium]